MRHKPTKPARPTSLPTDSGTESTRAGIRSLDCGHDDGDDAALSASTRADDTRRERPSIREDATSLGEQRQAL